MKKSSLYVLLSLCVFVSTVILSMLFFKAPALSSDAETVNSSGTQNDIILTPKDTFVDPSSLPQESSTKESMFDIDTCTSTTVSTTTQPEDSTTANTSEAKTSTAESITARQEDGSAPGTSEAEASRVEGTTAQSENSPKSSLSIANASTAENIIPQPNRDISMDDALFIGDSRTVGLMEYAGIGSADYFCTVGMSVYNIHNRAVSVTNVGNVTLTELLNSKKYGKIYIMLGINEVGYNFSITVKKYGELIELIKKNQPDAIIFIQANLHVTKSRSDSDKIINNTAINGLNAELKKLADGKSKFYLDANILFDDNTGGLSSDKSADSTHLYAKYYSEWGRWIISQTALLIGEG